MREGISLSLCFFAIVLCGIVRCDPCPPQEDIEPCVCNPYQLPVNITCSKITDTESLYAVFDKSGDFPFHQFQLQDCSLMYLPASAVKQKHMERITIVDSTMTSIFESRPDPSNSLYLLQLVNTHFQRGIEWSFFSSFKELAFLEMDGVEVKKIGKLFKDNINNRITVISIRNAKTAILEDGVFATLLHLGRLEITNSMIKTVKRSMFPNPSNLVYFDFSGNAIKTLPSDMFHNMPNLRSINLDKNKLTILPEAIYGDIYKRQGSKLSFVDNPLKCDCSLSWIFPKLPLRSVKGVCFEPPSKKGKSFDQLTPNDFPHC